MTTRSRKAQKPKFRVELGEVKHLRACYARDLQREDQASETVRDSMRKIIAVFDEVIEAREKGRSGR